MAGRGRGVKAHPPPSAANGWGTSRGLLVSGDELAGLASAAGLDLVVSPDTLANEAYSITEAFDSYSLWATVHDRASPPRIKAQWCAAVERQARELRVALGHLADKGTGDTAHSRDGMQILGWPADKNARHELERDGWRMEGQRVQAARLRGDNGASEAWWHFARERLPAGLHALETLARHAGRLYAAEVKRGGRDKDGPWWGLFCQLVGSFERQFATLPRVGQVNAPDENERGFVPQGPALTWFSELFRIVGARARVLGRQPDGIVAVRDSDLDPQYRVVAAAADRALKPPPADALTRAIREGVARWRKRTPEPPLDPDFRPTPLEDILKRPAD